MHFGILINDRGLTCNMTILRKQWTTILTFTFDLVKSIPDLKQKIVSGFLYLLIMTPIYKRFLNPFQK
jgi:hypothetical protein